MKSSLTSFVNRQPSPASPQQRGRAPPWCLPQRPHRCRLEPHPRTMARGPPRTREDEALSPGSFVSPPGSHDVWGPIRTEPQNGRALSCDQDLAPQRGVPPISHCGPQALRFGWHGFCAGQGPGDQASSVPLPCAVSRSQTV